MPSRSSQGLSPGVRSLLSIPPVSHPARRLPLAVLFLASFRRIAAAAPFELKDGDRVVFLGDTLIEVAPPLVNDSSAVIVDCAGTRVGRSAARLPARARGDGETIPAFRIGETAARAWTVAARPVAAESITPL